MAQNFGLQDYGGTGFVNRIRRARTPAPQTFSAPNRSAAPAAGRVAVPQPSQVSDYGAPSASAGASPQPPTMSGGRFFGNRDFRPPTASPLTPGAGDYSNVGPGDPGGYLSAPYSAEYPFPDVQSLVRYLIRGGGQAGALQPDYLRNMMRKRAMANAAAQRNRGRLAGTLAGFRPDEQREAILSSEISAGSDLTNALNASELSGGQDYMDRIWSLLSGERGGESSLFNQRDLMRLQDELAGSGWEQFLGQAAGSALGGLVPTGRSSAGGGGDYGPNDGYLR